MPERVLNACPACSRQYDVSHLDPGAAVRCDCGERFAARKPSPGAARAVHCSGCGGAVPHLAKSCTYCGAEIRAEDRGHGVRCPTCFARTAAGAAFCASCGGSLRAAARPAVPDGRSCPRCEGALRGETPGGVPVVACTVCTGVWLTPQAFDRVVTRARTTDGPHEAEAAGPVYEEQVRYVPCVGCGELMTRKRIGGAHGATVDLCRKHGMWFDAGELERVLAFVRGGGEPRTPWRDDRARGTTPRPPARREWSTSGPSRRGSGGGRIGGSAGGLFGADLIDLLGDLFLDR